VLLVRALKYPFRTALTVGVALAQIGEFSFILATLGRELGVLTITSTNALVATAIVSIVLNPIAYRTIGPVDRWMARRSRVPTSKRGEPAVASGGNGLHPDPAHRAVVVGYGPTGRTVVRLLRDNGIAPTVIELNMDAVRELRDSEGVGVVYGDAARQETLEAARVGAAGSLILGSAGMTNSAEVIRLARAMNPQIRVLARTSYLREIAPLKAAGANSIYSGEGEVALGMVEDILHGLGATPEQIDRERARAHSELVSGG
jgi:CPA2 family monovalent cation:H+ antiporter-2